MQIDLRHGDCVEVIKTLADSSVDAVVTDPPYELGFMGKGWDASGIAYSVEMWREVLRVLKPGGHLLAFGGTRTYHRMACAVEDAGFEIRDSLHWIRGGQTMPKSLNVAKALDKAGAPEAQAWAGWGTALKPSHEPIILARKPLAGTVAENVLAYGTGGLNVGACRVGTDVRVNPPAGNKPGTTALNMGVYGMPEDAEPTVAVGRWPSNVVFGHDLDCMDEVCTGECAVAELDRQTADCGGASRFFPVFRYQAKASRSERDGGLSAFPTQDAPASMNTRCATCNRLKLDHAASRCACAVHVPMKQTSREGAKNIHPTVKPVELMRWLVRLVTPPGGVVLEPFMGSGTTGVACVQEGFGFVGIEREAEYFEISKARIAAAQAESPAQKGLF